MVEVTRARELALSFRGAVEQDHFGRPSFRANKHIFATLWEDAQRMVVKLPLIEQSVFQAFDGSVFYPVPNKWGLKGATFIELAKVREEMLIDALNLSYEMVVTKKKKK
jgi:hypothetical protein